MAQRNYTLEFKRSAVQLVQQQGYSVPEAAKSLGIDAQNVRGWLKKLSHEEGMAPAGEGALAAELRRLRKENARLRMEREILKKAAAFFAKEQP
jgi:transposase